MNVTVPAVTQVAVTAGINPTFYDNVNQAKNIDTSLVMMKAVYSDGSSVQVKGTIGNAGNPVNGTTNVFDIPISYGGYSNTLRVYGYSAVGTAYSSNHIPSGTNKDILLVPGNYSVKTNGNVTPEEPVTPAPTTPTPTTPVPTTPVPTTPTPTEPETTVTVPDEKKTSESVSSNEVTSKDIITDKTTEKNTSSDTDSNSVLKVIKIVVIVLLVLCAGAAAVFLVFYLKNKNK